MSRYFNTPIRFVWLEAAKHVFKTDKIVKIINKNSKNALVKLTAEVFQGTQKVFLMDCSADMQIKSGDSSKILSLPTNLYCI